MSDIEDSTISLSIIVIVDRCQELAVREQDTKVHESSEFQ